MAANGANDQPGQHASAAAAPVFSSSVGFTPATTSRPATAPANLQPPAIPDHELLHCIGRGSYGDVWLARSKLGTYRAVKIVYRSTFEDSRPFEREFKGIQKFEPISRSHEGLVDILQVGGTEDYFYYVMELADAAEPRGEDGRLKIEDGEDSEHISRHSPSSILNPQNYAPRTLRAVFKQCGRLSVDECVNISLMLASALAHLHKHGLVHRDIKPSNIIFVNGVPKLADIGLVADTSEARSFVGTEGFIPPEGPGSPQADLYSLGKVLYEISTGQDRRDFPALPLDMVLTTDPTPALRSPSPLPKGRGQGEGMTSLAGKKDEAAFLELNAVIVKACKIEPRERYPSAEEMHDDLELLQRGKSVKRKRVAQRRLAFAKKFSIAASALALLGTGAWLLVNRLNDLTIQRSNVPVELNSVAVLPFGSESLQPARGYLREALTEETINAFAMCPGLRVASRSAVFVFRGATNEVRQIGAQLGVRTVLAGSFLRDSNGMHVTTCLLKVADGAQLWSASFDRGQEEFGALGVEVIRQEAQALGFTLNDDALDRARTNLMRKLAAFKLYSQAITNASNTQDGLDRSIRLLNQAIIEDPNYAQALAQLAFCHAEGSGFYLPQAQAMTAAKMNALHALQLDNDEPKAHRALAFVYCRHELDLAQAKVHFQRAIELAPNDGNTYGDFAWAYSHFGQFGEADEVLKRGEQASPKAHNLLCGWCWRYYLSRDFEKAREAANQLRAAHPDSIMGPWFMALAHEGLQQYDEALAVAQRVRQMDPSPDMVAHIGRLHARLGHRDEALRALEGVRALAQSPGVARTSFAEIRLALGETDRAVEDLQRAVDEYSPTVLILRAHPLWDELRSDARFQAALTKGELKK